MNHYPEFTPTTVHAYPQPYLLIRYKKFKFYFNILTWTVITLIMLREVTPDSYERLKFIYMFVDHIILPFVKWIYSVIFALIAELFGAISSCLT